MAIDGSEDKSMKESPAKKDAPAKKLPKEVLVYVGRKQVQILSSGEVFNKGEKHEVSAELAAVLKRRGEGREFVSPDKAPAILKAQEDAAKREADNG